MKTFSVTLNHPLDEAMHEALKEAKKYANVDLKRVVGSNELTTFSIEYETEYDLVLLGASYAQSLNKQKGVKQ